MQISKLEHKLGCPNSSLKVVRNALYFEVGNKQLHIILEGTSFKYCFHPRVEEGISNKRVNSADPFWSGTPS